MPRSAPSSCARQRAGPCAVCPWMRSSQCSYQQQQPAEPTQPERPFSSPSKESNCDGLICFWFHLPQPLSAFKAASSALLMEHSLHRVGHYLSLELQAEAPDLFTKVSVAVFLDQRKPGDGHVQRNPSRVLAQKLLQIQTLETLRCSQWQSVVG